MFFLRYSNLLSPTSHRNRTKRHELKDEKLPCEAESAYDETVWRLEAGFNWILPRSLHFHHQSSSLSVSHSLTFSLSL